MLGCRERVVVDRRLVHAAVRHEPAVTRAAHGIGRNVVVDRVRAEAPIHPGDAGAIVLRRLRIVPQLPRVRAAADRQVTSHDQRVVQIGIWIIVEGPRDGAADDGDDALARVHVGLGDVVGSARVGAPHDAVVGARTILSGRTWNVVVRPGVSAAEPHEALSGKSWRWWRRERQRRPRGARWRHGRGWRRRERRGNWQGCVRRNKDDERCECVRTKGAERAEGGRVRVLELPTVRHGLVLDFVEF